MIEKPAIYKIQVHGTLDETWSDRLANMQVTVDLTDEHGPVTTLVGCLRDQAALSGVLNTLYDLHLPVLSVKCLEQAEEQRADNTGTSRGMQAQNSS
jgi:hypothetical protein